MDSLKLERQLPIRVTLSLLAVGCFVLSMFCIGKWDLPATETYNALFGLLTVLGVGIGGDTVRPSGTVFSIFKTPVPKTPAAVASP